VKKIVAIGTGRMGGPSRQHSQNECRTLFQSAGLSQSNEKRKAMIDHIYLPVSDLKRSSEFYKKVLEPLASTCPTSSINLPCAVSPSITFRVSG